MGSRRVSSHATAAEWGAAKRWGSLDLQRLQGATRPLIQDRKGPGRDVHRRTRREAFGELSAGKITTPQWSVGCSLRCDTSEMEVGLFPNPYRPGIGLRPRREGQRPLLPQHARHCPVLEAGSSAGFLV